MAYTMGLLELLALATILSFNKIYLVFYVASNYCFNYFE